ncbi:hypothetical protein DUI87_20667 [Hirundo rustica rustica]|uniref:Uncharacterized protein n=1 Tax=Hirundo rustica rustica TaxID=333673 RepID=A0A3M0JR47_HIRRU|nr:hypothetical protein DUI87_20667 [Hirundo rustica rustica]
MPGGRLDPSCHHRIFYTIMSTAQNHNCYSSRIYLDCFQHPDQQGARLLCCQEVEVIFTNKTDVKLDHWRKEEEKNSTAQKKAGYETCQALDIVIKKLSSFVLQITKLQQA